MNMKMSEVIDSLSGLEAIAGQPVNAKVSWRIAGVIRQVSGYVDDFYKTRKALVDKYSEEGELSEENRAIIEQELREILEEEVTIDVKKINLDELGDVNIEPRFLVRLEWLIED